MRRLTKAELATFRSEFEDGLSVAAIARKYGVPYATLLKRRRLEQWTRWRSAGALPSVGAARTATRDFRSDDRTDRTLVATHLAEWRVVRRMLQDGVDRQDRTQLDFAQACATVLATIQDRERELRALVSRGRLKMLALRPAPPPPRPAPSPGRFTPKLRRPQQVHPAMAGAIHTIDDLVRVWMPADPPASAAHRRHWLGHIEAFCAFVGHRDPRLVTRADAFRWRDALLQSGLTARTVHNGRIAALRALFQYAVHADVLSDNPFANIVYRYDPKAFQRRGLTASEVKTILTATLQSFARQEPHTRAVRRWVPWLCALTGRPGARTQLGLTRQGRACPLRRQAQGGGMSGILLLTRIEIEDGSEPDAMAGQVTFNFRWSDSERPFEFSLPFAQAADANAAVADALHGVVDMARALQAAASAYPDYGR